MCFSININALGNGKIVTFGCNGWNYTYLYHILNTQVTYEYHIFEVWKIPQLDWFVKEYPNAPHIDPAWYDVKKRLIFCLST